MPAVSALGLGALLMVTGGMASPPMSPPVPHRLEPVVVTAGRAAPEMRILVNLPAFRLDVLVGDSLVRTFPVTIGKRGYETPTGEYEIGDIIFNPWWHPPQSDWAVGRKPEAPGPRNPMGRAKLNFAPLLYIHGSSNRDALGDVGSHGCVRLANEDVITLARIVQEFAAPGASALVEPLLATPTRTHQLHLDRRVVLEIRYDLAEVREGALHVHHDVYGLKRGELRPEVHAALARAGVAPERVDAGSLDAWLNLAPRALVTRSVRMIEIVAYETPTPRLAYGQLGR